MTESELLQGLFGGIQSVLTVFSLFFTLVSGYLAALYLMLKRAPLALRLVAFGLLSVGLLFLGGTAAVIQKLQDGLFAAWEKMPAPVIDVKSMRNPIPLELASALPVHQQQLGVSTGWAVAGAVYLALFYLTFVYRWPPHSAHS